MSELFDQDAQDSEGNPIQPGMADALQFAHHLRPTLDSFKTFEEVDRQFRETLKSKAPDALEKMRQASQIAFQDRKQLGQATIDHFGSREEAMRRVAAADPGAGVNLHNKHIRFETDVVTGSTEIVAERPYDSTVHWKHLWPKDAELAEQLNARGEIANQLESEAEEEPESIWAALAIALGFLALGVTILVVF